MLPSLTNLPIKRKILLVVMLTCSVVLLVATAALFLFQLTTFRKSFTKDLTALAEIVASTTRAAVEFDDQSKAHEILGALQSKPQIIHSSIALPDGSEFARFGVVGDWSEKQRERRDKGFHFEGPHLLHVEPIILADEQIGTLYLRSDYQKVKSQLIYLYAQILGGVTAASILIALLLSSRLQTVITGPILQLAETATVIAKQKDFSVRARKQGSDEVGLFTDAFNQMLTQIQLQDIAIHKAQQKLQTLIDSIEGVVWEWDPKNSAFTFVSKQAERILGFSAPEWLKQPDFWENRTHPDDRPIVLQGCREIAENKQSRTREYRMITANEETIWIRDSAGVVIDDDQTLLSGVWLDVTKEKEAAEELEELNRQLVESSRQAGMADVATSVLHNVGNVLNSINVSTTLISDQVRRSEIETLGKITDLLQDHREDLTEFISSDSKGKLIPNVILQLGPHLLKERNRNMKELESLTKNVDHVKEIVAAQQSYAKMSGVVQPETAPDLVEDALKMNDGSFERHGIVLKKEYQPVPEVAADKHKVLQVLVNVLHNAKHALTEAECPVKEIIIGIAPGPANTVHISVRDTGVGIKAEHLTKIFNNGFTTRPNGHGFGLHSAANAATEIGGLLTAHSEGLGRGATFVLQLPLAVNHQQS